MADKRPIGIFDSGIGGLTIAKAIGKLMPYERIIYFGDTAHLPYGDKSSESIRHYTRQIVKLLFDKGCKIVVIACNTASAIAYQELKKLYNGKKGTVINVIDPVIELLSDKNPNNRIGIIGTKRTIASRAYPLRIKKTHPHLIVSCLATPLLAPMVEEGFFNNNISQTIINAYLSKSNLKEIDTLILACTHYPLIKKEVANYYKGNVKILDSTEVVAKSVLNYLEKNDQRSDGNTKVTDHQFYVSDHTTSFEKTTSVFFGKKVKLLKLSIWE